MQSAAPAQNVQKQQSAELNQQPQMKRHRVAKHHVSQRNEVRQVQLRLKEEGLLKGKVTGKMDRQTRIALIRFEKQNGLPRTMSLARVDRMLATQTAGAGSSMPQMRTARLHKQQLTRTARLGKAQKTRIAHARMPKSQTTGVGSSMPNSKNMPVNSSSTNPAPASAGGTASTPTTTTPSSTVPTTPSTSTSK
jgi:peptidoglycan hydrolase-like protein with peptidoglycan-binding domain